MSTLQKTAVAIAVVLLLPALILGYGSVLGITYTHMQINAAGTMALASLLPLFVLLVASAPS
jgi:hypothetical protein